MLGKPIEFRVKAVIEFGLNERTLSKALEKALTPEASLELRGVKSKIVSSNNEIKLVIEAMDPSSFRASLNALLRLTSTLLNTLQVLKEVSNVNNI